LQLPLRAPQKRAPEIDRLLIVRLGSMGDIVHTLPAVTALRQVFPQASIGWIVEERWSELLCTLSEQHHGPRSAQRPLVDRLHLVDTKTWRSALSSIQTWRQIRTALRDLRRPMYQVAVDLQGAARSALIARWSGAATIFGSTQPRESIATMFYTRQVVPRGQHVVEQSLALAEAVANRKLNAPAVQFPHDLSTDQQCELRLREYGLGNFVVMNPGAGWGAKQWPAGRYGEVARRLAEWGLGSLINFGPGEGILARAVEATSEGAAESISCSLSQLIALTRRASLFIGGDTGPMHLAAALNVPVVALFGPTNPARNGPFGTRSVVLRSPASVTSHARVKDPEQGLLEITVDQVVAAAKMLLGAPRNAKLV
jgi:heptosyltransferase I